MNLNPALSTKYSHFKLRKSGVNPALPKSLTKTTRKGEMKPFVIKPLTKLKGKIDLPGDKSIAHRSIIISSLCKGKTSIGNFPISKDCLATINVFEKLGIKIVQRKKKKDVLEVTVFGKGLYGLNKSKQPIFVGDSGTTLRLILGVLAGFNFKTILKAGKSLSSRPMMRVTEPLRLMGAKLIARKKRTNKHKDEYPPIIIRGGGLRGITYKLPVASAQVKSAILLAGLYAKGKTCVIEIRPSRDHTERMLKFFRADIKLNKKRIVAKKTNNLISPGKFTIPGDISSAGFFIALATILKDSRVLVKNVSLNPSRLGLVRVLKRMGADIRLFVSDSKLCRFEPTGNILVKSSALKATAVKREEIPHLIDELPILMVVACFAKGVTILEGVEELRVKETDRINSMHSNLKSMGAKIRVKKSRGKEFILIHGKSILKGSHLRSYGDHRTAMSMIIAGLAATEPSYLDDISCINKSFPQFLKALRTFN